MKKSKITPSDIWCSKGIMYSTFAYCICLSEKQFKEQLDLVGIKTADRPPSYISSESANATTWTFTPSNKDNFKPFVIITIRDWKTKEPEQVVALIVHEATHLKQRIFKNINERKPSAELEAYTMQNLVQELLYSFNKQRERLSKGK
jgi:hypothetical protein